MLKKLHEVRKYAEDNKKLQNILSYYVSKREFATVIAILQNISNYTKDPNEIAKFSNLFITDKRAKEYFGLGEIIVRSMSNIVFGGNLALLSDDEKIQKELDDIMNDGYFLKSIIEAYRTSIATNGISYLFYNISVEYDTVTEVKTGVKFLNFDIVPEFELEIERNRVTRKFFKTLMIKDKEVTFTFNYTYETYEDLTTTLTITGYDDQDKRLSDLEVMEILNIDLIYEELDFIPYTILRITDGMLPNITLIENSLAENLYFQDVDLPNSQTQTYMPEEQLYEVQFDDQTRLTKYDDKYQVRHIVKGGTIDARESMALVVEGKSAISNIEKNLALNVSQACLDATISPVSIGYTLIEKMVSNTDVGTDKERVTIRLREEHIADLKIFVGKSLVKTLFLKGIEVELDDIAVLFAQYITPSIESQTNTLAKQVQFGLKSSERAVLELSRGELSDQELADEMVRIERFTTQRDFNVEQNLEKQKGVDNNLKSEK